MDAAELNGYMFLLFVAWIGSHIFNYIEEQIDKRIKSRDSDLSCELDDLENEMICSIQELKEKIITMNELAIKNAKKINELGAQVYQLRKMIRTT